MPAMTTPATPFKQQAHALIEDIEVGLAEGDAGLGVDTATVRKRFGVPVRRSMVLKPQPQRRPITAAVLAAARQAAKIKACRGHSSTSYP
jgi:hypothetical protein